MTKDLTTKLFKEAGVKLEDPIKESNKEKAENLFFIGLMAFMIVGVGYVVNEIMDNGKKNDLFYKTYQIKTIKYADIDKDGVITGEEKRDFNSSFLKQNNLKQLHGDMPYNLPKNSNGEIVSRSHLTKLLKNYNPEK